MVKDIMKYAAFTSNAIKEMIAYKFRAMIWVVYDFMFFFISYFLWKAVFESNGGQFYNISLSQYVSYIAISLVVAKLTRCNIDFDIADEVKNGNVAMSLLKPYSYIKMNFAKHFGYTIGGLFTVLPVLILASFFIEFRHISFLVGLSFFFSILFAFVLSFLFCLCIGLLAFWLTNINGLSLFKWNLIGIFSGQLISINLFFKIGENGFPNLPMPFMDAVFLQNFFKALGYISYMLPFQSMFYTPSAIYTGILTSDSQIIMHVILQIIWVLAMTLLVRVIWRNAQNKLTVMGG